MQPDYHAVGAELGPRDVNLRTTARGNRTLPRVRAAAAAAARTSTSSISPPRRTTGSARSSTALSRMLTLLRRSLPPLVSMPRPSSFRNLLSCLSIKGATAAATRLIALILYQVYTRSRTFTHCVHADGSQRISWYRYGTGTSALHLQRTTERTSRLRLDPSCYFSYILLTSPAAQAEG